MEGLFIHTKHMRNVPICLKKGVMALNNRDTFAGLTPTSILVIIFGDGCLFQFLAALSTAGAALHCMQTT